MNTKKRILYYELLKHLPKKEALVITGMRQVGKTTVMKQIFDEISDRPRLWFDLDNPLDMKFFEDVDYENIFKRLKKQAEGAGKMVVFIDEIQNLPEITKVIKYIIDRHGIKFIVTGSSSYYLRNLFPESLAGRKFLFELTPLSFGEFLYFKNESKSIFEYKNLEEAIGNSSLFFHKKYEQAYLEYIEFGGFPAVVLAPDNDSRRVILKNIFASFFEKDLRILSDFKDIRELRDIILLLAPRVGSLLDITKISSELRVSRAKVYDYLEFLQGVFLLRLLPKHSKSIDRSIAGGRKAYFTDSGLLNMLGQISESQLFENTLANQLKSYASICFYNKRNVSEIDFIADNAYSLEAKLRGADQDMKKLAKLSESLKIKKYFIVSKYYTEKEGFITPTVFM